VYGRFGEAFALRASGLPGAESLVRWRGIDVMVNDSLGEAVDIAVEG
jgi:hypothetical protein